MTPISDVSVIILEGEMSSEDISVRHLHTESFSNLNIIFTFKDVGQQKKISLQRKGESVPEYLTLLKVFWNVMMQT